MAGVAPKQRGGSNATTIGMVTAIIVAVLELGVLIWMFTLQEQLRARADDADRIKTKLVRGNDERTARKMFPDVAIGSKTLVGEMNKGIQLLVQRLTGDKNDTPQAAIAKLDEVMEQASSGEDVPDEVRERLSPDFGAVKVIEALHELYLNEEQTLAKAEEESDKANAGLDMAETTKQKLQAEFDAKVAKLEAKVKDLQQAKDAFENDKNSENSALARQVAALRDELDQKRQDVIKLKRKFLAALAEQNELLEEQRVALKELRGPAPLAAQPLALARKPLGKVLRALPGDSLLHINLGREDNAVLGMTFSVYSADERVPVGGRGKASIEVVSVSPRTSECRIVAAPSPDDPILEGDLVGNIMLSRNRAKKPQFCVVGQFDVDFDGQVDVRGREKIQSLIERWGGVVVERVTPMTDYVVVGLEPPGQDVSLSGGFGNDIAKEATVKTADSEDESIDEDEADADEDEVDADEDADEDDESGDLDDEDDSDDESDLDDEGDDEDDDADDDSDDSDDSDDGDDELAAGNGGPGVDASPTLGIPRVREIDPTVSPRKHRYQNEGQRYEDALRRARMFSIPVLTQEQFFNFIGIEGAVSDVRRIQG